ncbi:sialate O-acetylesterase [Lewinella sp. W8]|uniref:sialate O-acetylesterase n=1 Tax=Lewinella sp. W8 TaxID=2528208 RepID=UPI00106841BC|nr:sialate O-acetylesterase [Lewinella sp. W8]MTB51446.1 9-O-acetylesterase [Lewinella sp. W8]
MRNLLLCLFVSLLSLPMAAQDLSVFELFTDQAILQREAKHPIWGWAKPRQTVTITLGDQEIKTRADKSGKWMAELPPMPAGGPHQLSIAARRQTITMENIYFGDVFLLSGQSNMEWRLQQSDPDGSRARDIADPMIREIKVERVSLPRPQEHLPISTAFGRGWRTGTADNIKDFSGVGSYFAHYLRESVEVPIGLVHSSWGGSRIEPWMSAEALGLNGQKAIKEREDYLASIREEGAGLYRTTFGGEPPVEEVDGSSYVLDNVDTKEWGSMQLPGMWEGRGYRNVDGVFYFRRSFTLTAAQAAGAAELFLGAIDDSDETYLNGKRVGGLENSYSVPREYAIPSGILRAGENNITIKVTDTGGGGGLSATPEMLRLETAAGTVALAGQWRYRVGLFRVDAQSNQVPTLLYNAMIHPMKGWPLKGVLWYQGESNAGGGDAEAYAQQFKTLISSWRTFFNNPDLPFYWVQLANFTAPPTSANDPGWAVLRKSQTAALDLPHTGQAVITDIGEADDIHPRNKWEVGRRLSLHALKNIYGKTDLQAASPRATRAIGERNKTSAVVKFAEIGQGLMVKNPGKYGYLKGFTLQDLAGKWHYAQAYLDPTLNEVRILNPARTGVAKVRYAWASNPDDANLFSKEGLPVTPFELVVE